MRLDYPRHKIVEWSPMHFRLCDYNDFDRNTFRSAGNVWRMGLVGRCKRSVVNPFSEC
jgi:hypothetical protein